MLPDQVTTPSSSRSPRCTARIASLVIVRPLRHTWTTSRGVRVNAPHPVSLLLMHEPGEDHRVVRPGRAGERAPVARQQRRGQSADLLADDADVHPPLGQVAPVDLDRDPGGADAVQGGEEDVEVVDPLVPVRQERPRRARAGAGGRAQAADQELARSPRPASRSRSRRTAPGRCSRIRRRYAAGMPSLSARP